MGLVTPKTRRATTTACPCRTTTPAAAATARTFFGDRPLHVLVRLVRQRRARVCATEHRLQRLRARPCDLGGQHRSVVGCRRFQPQARRLRRFHRVPGLSASQLVPALSRPRPRPESAVLALVGAVALRSRLSPRIVHLSNKCSVKWESASERRRIVTSRRGRIYKRNDEWFWAAVLTPGRCGDAEMVGGSFLTMSSSRLSPELTSACVLFVVFNAQDLDQVTY